MKQVKITLMMLALALFVVGGLYAYGHKTETVKPATYSSESKMMKHPAEEGYNMMRVHYESVIANSRALDHYSRHNEGRLRKDIVDQHIQGIDRGIVRAEKRLAKLEKRVGMGTFMEHEELARIGAHQEVVAETLSKLKAEAAKSPMSGTAIAGDAEKIHQEMKRANDEARTLAIKLDFRNPGETEGRMAAAKPMEPGVK
jgi:hypothetical protein